MTLPVRLLEMSRDDIRERVDQGGRGVEHGDALQPHAFVGSPLLEINVNVVQDFEMVGDESNGGNEDVPMPFPMQIVKGGSTVGPSHGSVVRPWLWYANRQVCRSMCFSTASTVPRTSPGYGSLSFKIFSG